jgi:arylsulfatase A-like enzyme
VAFLSEEKEQPFIVTVGFSRPHSPWYAPQEFFDMFPLETIELAPYLKDDLEDCAKILAEDRDLAEPWGWFKYEKIMNNGGEEKLKRWTQAYLACVAFVDAQVGKVLDAIEAREDADNTLVIFTSDHGYHMGEKDYIFKLTPWEESVRVPLVVSGPNVAKGKESKAPVSLIDVFPTCLDYAELEASHTLDGHSLKPLLENPSKGKWEGDDFSLSACGSQMKSELHQPALVENQHFSIRTEQFRYIRCRNGEEELYDHYADPNEWKNLSNSSFYKIVLNSMRKRLDKALENAVN